MWYYIVIDIISYFYQLSYKLNAFIKLSGGTQRGDLFLYQSEEMKILNMSFPQVEIEPTICHFFYKLLFICNRHYYK